MRNESQPLADAPDHKRIAAAIAYLQARAEARPGLEETAAHVGLSPAHFQRIFSRWAGVSPKKYQQYLTLDHARRLLRERRSLLDASLEAGLSGPSRLHDLFLSWEAMTPGEFARAGAGLTIHYCWSDSPFGPALIMATERGICGLAIAAPGEESAAMADMRGRWPKADFQPAKGEALDRLRGWADAAFGGKGAARLHMIGAPFQIKVWEALLRIPSGHVTSYGAIAAHIGAPKAARAVGTAVGRNPISWLIPCHRVLRGTGALGGYHWGLPVKRAMLAYESARHDADAAFA